MMEEFEYNLGNEFTPNLTVFHFHPKKIILRKVKFEIKEKIIPSKENKEIEETKQVSNLPVLSDVQYTITDRKSIFRRKK